MSGKIVGWAMEQRTGSPAAKLVLVKLADNANEQGFCWPSVELIVEHTELGQSTVYKHLAALEELGLLKQVDHLVRGTPVKGYFLAAPGLVEEIPPRRKAASPIPPGGNEIPPRGEAPPPGGKKIPPAGMHIEEPPIEPSEEPSGEPSGAPPPPACVSPTVAAPQDSLPGLDPPKPAPPKPKSGKGKKANPNRIEDQAVLTAAIDAYNAAAVRLGWAECMNPHEERQRRLGARLVEGGGIEGWKVALEKSEASDFLMGRTPAREGHKQFRLDIDFLLQVSSFTRLMEGFYDNRNRNSGAGASLSPIRAAARAVAEGLDR